jgi:hypothetical protein
VENRGASLDSTPTTAASIQQKPIPFAWPGDTSREKPFLRPLWHNVTGIRKKDKGLKEKTVVPVVQTGKVDIQPKQLWAMGLIGCFVF